MFDFYIITSFIVNVLLFVVWTKNDLSNFLFKVLFLILACTGGLIIINTYHLIGS